ncbi:30S ribosomal protein S2 [bacterium]|nr:30S ribosomal protein S2 [bacterium]
MDSDKVENEAKELNSKKGNFSLDVQEMMEAGLHFGHRISRTHPKMRPYIFGIRGTVHIIDLEKTVQKMQEALTFIKELVSEGKSIMIIGTKIQVRDIVREMAEECGLPYVNQRWIGGTFTNFDFIRKRIDYLKELEKKKAENAFEKYTKKERAKIDKEIRDLEEKFGGIKNLEKLPDAIFVIDMNKEKVAIKEAKKKGIKIIAIADTNADPTLADYPIPANDDAMSSVRYILDKVAQVIKKYKK